MVKVIGDDATVTIRRFSNDAIVDKLVFSPDGKKLLISAFGGEEPDFNDLSIVYDINSGTSRSVSQFLNWHDNNQLKDGLKGEEYYDLGKKRYFKIAPDLHGYVAWASEKSQDGQRIVITNNPRESQVHVGKNGNWHRLQRHFEGPDAFISAKWIGKNQIGILEEQSPNKLLIFDKESGELLRSLTTPIKSKGSYDNYRDFYPSPDGSQVLLERMDDMSITTIWLINPTSGKTRKLLKGHFSWPYWLPDNKQFLINENQKDGRSDIWLAGIKTDKILIKRELTHYSEVVDWTPY